MLGRRPIKEARLAFPKRNGAADCLQPETSPATATAMRAISREATGRCEDRKAVPEVVVAEARRLPRKSPKTGMRRSLRTIASELAALKHRDRWPAATMAHVGGVGWGNH